MAATRKQVNPNLNESVIERLTGATREIIAQSSYNQDSKDKLYWNRYLDSRIRNI